ncbi:beta-lactamase family protein [Rhodocytophaga rosea]|uniref:Beta-lactamase family protein n=1 Tax=Rhodocytophaga rosea TaxID=2704465 RepID=A0A6C0GT23_9BACT|nr:beta-lactamase family protein [Rhodocytophaga rosea]
MIYVGSRADDKGNPITNPLFEIGELSSLFTTTLLARMAILGEVNLETPVQELLPGQHLPVYQKLECEPIGSGYSLYACDPLANDQVISMVLCNLATHSAGFPKNPSNLKTWLHPKNPYARYTTSHLYRYLNNHPISFTSGFTYQYSHIGMALLGHSLSVKSGLPYSDLLQEKVLIPLSLSDTRITVSAAQQSRLLPGYTAKGKLTPHWDFDVLAPSAGMQSSIEDMLQFLSVQMGQSHREWLPVVKLAQNPREVIRQKDLAGSTVGLGWLTTKVPGIGGEEVTWMEGQTGGFSSYIGLLNGQSIGVVILSNHARPVSDLGIQVLKTLDQEAKEAQSIPAAIR